MARLKAHSLFVSLNSRLESNKEEEEGVWFVLKRLDPGGLRLKGFGASTLISAKVLTNCFRVTKLLHNWIILVILE